MSIQVITDCQLAFWNLGRARPHIEDARQRLEQAELNPARADAIPYTTALRRAADNITGTRTGLSFKAFRRRNDETGQDSQPRVQIDRELADNAGIRRERVGVYGLDVANQLVALPDSCQETLARLQQAYGTALQFYTGADISAVIMAILKKDGLGVYSPRKAGGVYFVPCRSFELLDRLESWCRGLGVRFLRYGVPDTADQRAEIAEAIHGCFSDALDAHQAAIDAYTDATRPGCIENRQEMITATVNEIAAVRNFLTDANRDDLRARVQAMREACERALQVARSGPDQQRPRGRRIATR